jgi:hypothetical protein
MFFLTIKLPDRKAGLLAAGFAAALLVGTLALISGRSRGATVSAVPQDPVSLCLSCLGDFGWEVEETPISSEACLLSENLSETFLLFQQEAGFDLTPYIGETVTRYTFRVTNYPTGEEGVLADLLVFEGAVIGGDIRSNDLSGFLHSLLRPEALHA